MRTVIACLLLFVVPPLAMLVKHYQGFQIESPSDLHLQGPREVLFFNASWCGPCRQMKPIVAQLRRQGYHVRDVDVDKNRTLAQKYGIRAIPTFVFVEQGSEVNRFSGGTSPENLRKLCSNYR
jgi:thiol-disulfide isomerase/thioredoxin